MLRTLLWIFGISVLGGSWTSAFFALDTQLLQAYEQTRYGSNIRSLSAGMSLGNLYDQALALQQGQQVQSVAGGMNQAVDAINTQFQCSLTSRDLMILLVQNASFAAKVQTLMRDQGLESPTNTDFLQSCERLLACSDPKLSVKTRDGRARCVWLATDLRQNAARRQDALFGLVNDQEGDQIFHNGKADDAPYDLLIDIQQISKILFESTQSVPEVLFFEMPDYEGQGNAVSGDPLFDPFVGTLGGGIGSLGLSTISSSLNVNSSAGISSLHSSGNGSALADAWRRNQNVGNTNATGLVFGQQICLPDGTIVSVTGNGTNGLITSGSSSGFTFPSLSGLRASGNNGGVLIGSGLGLGSGIQVTNDLVDKLLDVNADPDSANACLAKCDGLGFFDKLACRAQCLCGTTSSAGGVFQIRFCRVPVQTKTVATNQRVLSFEEMVNESLNTLINLRDSGELVKHKQTKEHLESGMQKVKLSQMLSFDFALSTKPLFKNIPDSRKNNEAKDKTQNLQRQIAGFQANLDAKPEKTKYVVLAVPERFQQSEALAPTFDEFALQQLGEIQTASEERAAQIIQTQQSLMKLQQGLGAVMSDEITLFIENNLNFRVQMEGILQRISLTAQALKGRIESAKK